MLSAKLWRAEVVVQFIGFQMAFICLGGMVVGLLDKLGVKAFALPDGPGAVVVGTMCFQGVTWGLIGFFLWQHGCDWRTVFGLRDPQRRSALAQGAVLACLLLPVLLTMQAASAWVMTRAGLHSEQETAVQLLEGQQSIGMRLYLGVFAVFLAPVAEEFIFRGMLFPFVKQLGFPRLAWLGVSALFAFIHLDAAIFIPLFVLALGLTWLYVKTGNLLAAITAHAVFNAVNLGLLVAEPWLTKVLHIPGS